MLLLDLYKYVYLGRSRQSMGKDIEFPDVAAGKCHRWGYGALLFTYYNDGNDKLPRIECRNLLYRTEPLTKPEIKKYLLEILESMT